MAATDACRLHAPVGGEVGRAERQALHARRRGADRLDVGDAAGRLEDRVDEDRPAEPGLGLELGEQAVDVVDVLGALDLGDHDHVEAVADLGHGGGEVVERPRRVERVDPGPQLRVGRASHALPISTRPARAASLSLAGTPSSRLASRTSTVGAISGTLATIFGFDGGRKWIIRDGRNGISRTGSGAPTASGRKKSLGGRTAAQRTRSCDCSGRREARPSRARRADRRPGPRRSSAGRSTGPAPLARAWRTRPRACRALPSNGAGGVLTPAEPTAGSGSGRRPVPGARVGDRALGTARRRPAHRGTEVHQHLVPRPALASRDEGSAIAWTRFAVSRSPATRASTRAMFVSTTASSRSNANTRTTRRCTARYRGGQGGRRGRPGRHRRGVRRSPYAASWRLRARRG